MPLSGAGILPASSSSVTGKLLYFLVSTLKHALFQSAYRLSASHSTSSSFLALPTGTSKPFLFPHHFSYFVNASPPYHILSVSNTTPTAKTSPQIPIYYPFPFFLISPTSSYNSRPLIRFVPCSLVRCL